MTTRREEAEAMVRGASADTIDDMQRRGWTRCSEVLDESDAIVVAEDELGDADYTVAVTRTCCGYIVWRTLTE